MIVVVDDTRINATVLARLLNLAGCPSKPLFCGKDLFEYLNSQAIPQLVILDMRMPHMNGMECLVRLHTNAHWQLIPVIVYSADCDGDQVQEAQRLGARDYLVKGTMQWLELLAKIKGHAAVN